MSLDLSPPFIAGDRVISLLHGRFGSVVSVRPDNSLLGGWHVTVAFDGGGASAGFSSFFSPIPQRQSLLRLVWSNPDASCLAPRPSPAWSMPALAEQDSMRAVLPSPAPLLPDGATVSPAPFRSVGEAVMAVINRLNYLPDVRLS